VKLRWDLLITLVCAALSIAVEIISQPYTRPYLGVITSFFSICFLILLFLGWMCLIEFLLIFSETDRIEYHINKYVIPWQKEFVARVLLTNREVQDSNFFEAKDRLAAVVRFLETTDNTKHLRDILVMPSLRPHSIRILKHWLRKCNLDGLSTKTRILRHLESIMTSGRESEVSACIASVAGSIVPYRKLCRGLSKMKSSDESLDEALAFTDEDQMKITDDVVLVYKWELDLWSSSIPARSAEMTPETLSTKAHRAIRLGSVLLALLVLAIASVIYLMLRTPTTEANLISGSLMMAMVIASTIIEAQWLLVGAKNRPALARLLEGATILGLSELYGAAARIVQYGLDYGKLPNVVTLDNKNVAAWDFVYCCAHACLDQQKKGLEPVVWFPTNHSVVVQSEEYFFFRTPSFAGSFETLLTRDLSEQEFIDLSSRIVSVPESAVDNAPVEEGQIERLLWLYSNALRIGIHEFHRIEVADVGTLPYYVLTQRESRWAWLGNLKRRMMRVFSAGLLE
jgi:hypothetical protein